MMSDLKEKEQILLELLKGDQKLQFYTFNRIEGLKWFDELKERGFIDPTKNPEPVPGDEEGSYRIPMWDILKYLLKTSKQLSEPENVKYIGEYLEFIRKVTLEAEAKDSQRRNYRTWVYFSQILSNIPSEKIEKDFVEEIVSKWFNDNFTSSLVVNELGNILLIKLIDSGQENAALSLLSLIVEVSINDETKFRSDKFSFRGNNYQVKKVLEDNLEDIAKLGIAGVTVLENSLAFIFNNSDKDLYSFIWRPAIEDHEQNGVGFQDEENILITSIRDLLSLLIEKKNEEDNKTHIRNLLESEYTTYKRIAIYQVNYNWNHLKELASKFLKSDFFNYEFQHELYWFLYEHFSDLNKETQKKVLQIISDIDDYSDEEYKAEQIAFDKLTWLTAIKNSGNPNAKQLYVDCYNLVGSEPEHPDFTSYMKSGVVADKSPVTAREIMTLDTNELIDLLNNFEENRKKLNAPNKRGLTNELLKAVKSNPKKFLDDLNEILKLRDLYLSQLIKAFTSLWNENISFNHKKSLEACIEITGKRKDLYKEKYSLTLKAISKYITEATKSDEHAFKEDLLPLVNGIIKNILANLDRIGDDNLSTSDEVTMAINNNKGQAVEALINYSLRRCRLEQENTGRHERAWNSLEHFYNTELDKIEENNFEFHALVTMYLPNMLYLSRDWVKNNLDKIFPKGNRMNWKAAINGFCYSKYLGNIFEYLLEADHFVDALDEENLKFENKKRLIQYASLNYLITEDSNAISVLMDRWNDEEMSKLAWSIWNLKDKIDDTQKKRVLDFWLRLYEKLKDSQLEKLLSNLNYWVDYVDEIDEEREQFLSQCAPYACIDYNAPFLVKGLARLVDHNPKSVAKIFQEMLKECTPDYDKEHITHIVEVLKKSDYDKEVEQINEHYLNEKMDFVAIYLNSL